MASGSSTTKRKGRPTKAQQEKQRRQAELARKKKQQRERTAIILFGCGIFLTALAFVQGESIWKTLHETFFGLFGVLAYLAGPFAFWFAIAYAFGKNPPRPVMVKGILLFFAISGALLIFGQHALNFKFEQDMVVLFNDGKLLSGGGASSFLFGWTLLAGCGETAAKVVIVAAIFLLFMLITGKTVVDLVNGVRRPIDVIRERAQMDAELEEYEQETEQETPPAQSARNAGWFSGLFRAKSGQRFDIDVPIDQAPPVQDPNKGYEPAPEPAATPETEPEPLPEPAPAPLPIDFSSEGKRRTAQIAKEATVNRTTSMSSIDIPLGPDFEPQPEKGLGDLDIIVNPHNTPTGPAADVVSDLLRQQETVSSLFTDFSASQQEETPNPAIYSTHATRRAAPAAEPADFARRMEGIFAQSAAANKEDIPHLFETDEQQGPFSSPAQAAEQTRQEIAKQEYRFPPLSLLDKQKAEDTSGVDAELRANADALVRTLDSFGVKTRLLDVAHGPSVTRYELQPETGVRLNKIVNLADDLALNLAAEGVRIEAPIPGKAAVGIEVPNKIVSTVNLRSVIESDVFRESKAPLTFAIGKDIGGAVRCGDISKMPHLLIAGSTGMGKSVCINSMLISLVYKSAPKDLQLILIDPKMVEFTCYAGLPHLYIPVVTDPKKAAGALGSAVGEMMKRYKLFSQYGVRNIGEYNAMVERAAQSGEPAGTDEGEPLEKKPRMVIVIDELADLMMTSPNEVEDAICRIAQMGRAAGMHLVVATQRPSVDVITGTIKNNIPTRIAFKVSSQIDSRTIIDGSGAEKLIGRGDMLFLPVGQPKPIRIQGCFVSDAEVNRVVDFLKQFAVAQYNEQFIQDMEEKAAQAGQKGKSGAAISEDSGDPLLEDAIEVVVEAGQASTSLLQRRLKLGYGRAARIMDEMFDMGIIGPSEGSKPREVRMTRQQWQERLMNREEP